MRKIILCLLLLSPIVGCFAQKKAVENLFKEAIKRGMNSDCVYIVDNSSKQKTISFDDMKKYVISQGYISLGGTEVKVHRFGDMIYILDKLSFTAKDSYEEYVYAALGLRNFKDAKAKGAMFLPFVEMILYFDDSAEVFYYHYYFYFLK